MTAGSSSPVLVSFYSNDSYYQQAADNLRADCLRVGLDCDIEQLDGPPDQSWPDICRRKVPYLLEKHRKHARAILWLDVDSRLAGRPDIFDGATCDMAGFLRGRRYLRGFDPLALPRFFAPFALYFNATPAAAAFLELMSELERRYSGPATDDFFLQEAWAQHRHQLSVMILPPDLVGDTWPLRDRQVIHVGISGNAGRYKELTRQHVAEELAPLRRKAVLLHEADSARRAGQNADALLLYRHALAVTPDDEALADRIARLSRQQTGVMGAQAPILRSIWKRWLPSRGSK
jgi:hypothetical protein